MEKDTVAIVQLGKSAGGLILMASSPAIYSACSNKKLGLTLSIISAAAGIYLIFSAVSNFPKLNYRPGP